MNKKNIMLALLLIAATMFAAYTNGLFDSDRSGQRLSGPRKLKQRESGSKRKKATKVAQKKQEFPIVIDENLVAEVKEVIHNPWGRDPFVEPSLSKPKKLELKKEFKPRRTEEIEPEINNVMKGRKGSPKGLEPVKRDEFEQKSKNTIKPKTPEEGPPMFDLKMIFFNGRERVAKIRNISGNKKGFLLKKGDFIGKEKVAYIGKDHLVFYSDLWGKRVINIYEKRFRSRD